MSALLVLKIALCASKLLSGKAWDIANPTQVRRGGNSDNVATGAFSIAPFILSFIVAIDSLKRYIGIISLLRWF